MTQSVEFGGRISDVSGSQAMYDTLVNNQSGARLLEQSLTMRSLTHEDLFDSLTLDSFGWGGDPEQAARMRISSTAGIPSTAATSTCRITSIMTCWRIL